MIDDSNGNGAGHERRKSPRAPLAVALEISGENNRQYPGKGFVTNLSEGGLAWETPHVFSQGEAVLIRFSLPQEEPFDVRSEVLYSKEGVLSRAYGARFCDVHPEILAKIRGFVRSRQSH
jgi:hypothetical protein